MDSPNIVDIGLSQMLSELVDNSMETELEACFFLIIFPMIYFGH